jgi:hypothetical protein
MLKPPRRQEKSFEHQEEKLGVLGVLAVQINYLEFP